MGSSRPGHIEVAPSPLPGTRPGAIFQRPLGILPLPRPDACPPTRSWRRLRRHPVLETAHYGTLRCTEKGLSKSYAPQPPPRGKPAARRPAGQGRGGRTAWGLHPLCLTARGPVFQEGEPHNPASLLATVTSWWGRGAASPSKGHCTKGKRRDLRGAKGTHWVPAPWQLYQLHPPVANCMPKGPYLGHMSSLQNTKPSQCLLPAS